MLVDDSAALRDLLAEMLAGVADIEIVGVAGSETTAIDLLRRLHPDLAIIDLELQSGTGLKVLAALHDLPPGADTPRAVVFSNHTHPIVRERCRMLGAQAFFDKSFQLDELLAYVHAATDAPGAHPG
ncbi:response regulator transcription factor [Zoogloea sp. LCSB751]|uniref:response regulator n=1 Tax=Zoogloea sp. LCSB751 TaxID=1965277 RepID=UPI0020B12567|nr:response regulator transcription factor [Zoogloea sp. LCSB751]